MALGLRLIAASELASYSSESFAYVDERGPSSKVMCDAIHRLPFEPGGLHLHHVKGAWKFLYTDDPMAPATATVPPKLEICDPDGSKCKLLNAR